MLGWVGDEPAEALELAAAAQRDLIGELVALADPGIDYRHWRDVAFALSVFPHPAATQVFLRTLATATEADPAFDSAEALSTATSRPTATGW